MNVYDIEALNMRLSFIIIKRTIIFAFKYLKFEIKEASIIKRTRAYTFEGSYFFGKIFKHVLSRAKSSEFCMHRMLEKRKSVSSFPSKGNC